MKEKLEQLISKANVEDIDTYEYWERGGSFIRYYEDNYSGGTEQLWIDDQGYLRQSFDDDSPEQVGGWVVTNVFVNDRWYPLNHICDVFSYAVKDNKVFAITCDFFSTAVVFVYDTSSRFAHEVTVDFDETSALCTIDDKEFSFPAEWLQNKTCTAKILNKILTTILDDYSSTIIYKDRLRSKLRQITDKDNEYAFSSAVTSYISDDSCMYYLDQQDNLCRMSNPDHFEVRLHKRWYTVPLSDDYAVVTYVNTRRAFYPVSLKAMGEGYLLSYGDKAIYVMPDKSKKIIILTSNSGKLVRVHSRNLQLGTCNTTVLRNLVRKLLK